MNNQKIIDLLLKGETVSITCDKQAKEIQKQLREISKNCKIILSQLNERLK